MRKYLSPALAFSISAGLGASVMTSVPGISGTVYTTNVVSVLTLAPSNPPPPNAFYHQVVDRYYDASGQEVETRSSSHVVGYDCHSGRRQQDLIVEDDGKGGQPRFVALLMGNEPTEGQKSITAEDKVKIIMAANKNLPPAEAGEHTDDIAAPAAPSGSVRLAANR